ncbi:MAG: two-component system response regulator [Rickettsiales bacterium]|nr:two-component system response regulator [Rickettsiales bacterium]|tara:strand:+ start:5096 stop:5473 length:378 start_codon:yes stop_codon:yes gene_type:complete
MKTFLVVDDSGVVRKVARKILEELNFKVDEAEDGQVALDYCTGQGMPDAVLLDWNMPVMTGIEFLKELRQTPGGDQPIVLFCTTENDIKFIQEALSAGANEYIMKPFDGEIIKNKLVQVGLYSGD